MNKDAADIKWDAASGDIDFKYVVTYGPDKRWWKRLWCFITLKEKPMRVYEWTKL